MVVWCLQPIGPWLLGAACLQGSFQVVAWCLQLAGPWLLGAACLQGSFQVVAWCLQLAGPWLLGAACLQGSFQVVAWCLQPSGHWLLGATYNLFLVLLVAIAVCLQHSIGAWLLAYCVPTTDLLVLSWCLEPPRIFQHKVFCFVSISSLVLEIIVLLAYLVLC